MQPLLLTRDRSLVDEVARLSAAAGVRPEVYDDPLAALAAWPRRPAGPGRGRPRRRGGRRPAGDGATGCTSWAGPRRTASSAPRWPSAPARSGSCPSARAGWSTCSPTPRRRPGGGGPSASIGGAGGAGASTFACALGQVAAARGPDAAGRHRPARARPRPDARPRVGAPGCGGATSRRAPAGSGRGPCARRCRGRHGGLGALTWASGAVLEPDADGGPRGGGGRPAGPRPGGARPRPPRHGAGRRARGAVRPAARGRAGDARGRRVHGAAPRPGRRGLRGGARRASGRGLVGRRRAGHRPAGRRRGARAAGTARSRSTSASGRCATTGCRSPGPPGRCWRRPHDVRPTIAPGLLDEVRERLAATPGDLSPHRVAEALRAAGRPVGDAMVLAVHDELRRDVLGAGPLEPLLRRPGVTDVLVNGADEVWVDCGDGLELTGVRFPDDVGGAPPRPAAGRDGWSAARRRHPARRRAAARRHPLPRGARADGASGDGGLPAGPAGPGLHDGGPGGRRRP